MTLNKLASAPVDLSTVGPVAVTAMATTPDTPDTLEAILAASASRSAKLSSSMTQLLLEAQSSSYRPNDAALRALFRPKR